MGSSRLFVMPRSLHDHADEVMKTMNTRDVFIARSHFCQVCMNCFFALLYDKQRGEDPAASLPL